MNFIRHSFRSFYFFYVVTDFRADFSCSQRSARGMQRENHNLFFVSSTSREKAKPHLQWDSSWIDFDGSLVPGLWNRHHLLSKDRTLWLKVTIFLKMKYSSSIHHSGSLPKPIARLSVSRVKGWITPKKNDRQRRGFDSRHCTARSFFFQKERQTVSNARQRAVTCGLDWNCDGGGIGRRPAIDGWNGRCADCAVDAADRTRSQPRLQPLANRSVR